MSPTMVIGVDDSSAAPSVTAQAVWLAELLGLRPVLAHVVEDPPNFPYGGEAMRDRARRRLAADGEDLLERIAAAAKGAELRTLSGRPADALERLAAGEDGVLVAVGSRGRGSVRSALMGSVSGELATSAGRPVLVVPPGAEQPRQGRPNAIACGVDGSEHSDVAVRAAAVLARALGTRLVLVHAHSLPALPAVPAAGVGAPLHHHAELVERQRETGYATLDRAAQLADDGELDVITRLDAGNAAALLEEVAGEEDAALVAVGARGLSPVRAALLGSTSVQLTRLASRPVLIVPPGARLALERAAAHGVA